MLSLVQTRQTIDTRLQAIIPPSSAGPKRLQEALAHTLLAPGKRFRPILTLLVGAQLGADDRHLLDAACAGEMVHTASLILDDLPCMDDAPLRRNRASAHIQFDESTAILTAVALLNRAFGIIARCEALDPEIRVAVASKLSRAVGANGLIAGQLADIANTGDDAKIEDIERLNQLKTGALFDYAILSAARIAKASPVQMVHLTEFSRQLGLAFQLLDDVKDVMMSETEAEKSTGRDVGKATIVALTGSEASLSRLRTYLDAAKSALRAADFPEDSRVLTAIDTQFSFAYA